MRIDDDDILLKLEEVEGADWRRQQESRRTAPHSFYWLLAAWEQRCLPEHRDIAEIRDFLDAEPVLYGAGGYNRYLLRDDGTLLFSRMHARLAMQERATKAGFRFY